MNITKTPAILKRNPLSRKEKNVMKVVFMSAYLPAKACGTVWGLGFGSIFHFSMPGEASAAARQKYLTSKND
ncbi:MULTISPECIES: hypothetical protein [Klebsiella]|uniref:hypothetical protein n=1 Tax=Klebsiella TaxID=570 RepID=UPI001CA79490|nr:MULTISPECIES: hypothetical protein [Klebsiella]MBZ7662011.1 hypothetical protein [Klebsiella grimontii]QZY79562.1 hypothetical protein K7H21_25175 [Klebsiella sp. CTHL.F3a]